MSHNLTQPEEVDHILMTMVGHDMEADTPVPGGVQISETILDAECDGFDMVM
jgi:hypothetical protein